MDKFVGKRLDGRYEIREIIGVGGMAVVYKAYDCIEDRIVAVKILKEEFISNEEFISRFKNESKAIAVLNHPNIVKVYDVSFGDLIQYIVMEYVDGITLKQYISQQKSLRWKDAVYLTIQVLRALQHAHDKGIVHRDVKPQNIMLLADGTIKVTDFGIARFARSEHKTMTDKAIGSVHYISPEQARGDATDEKADIYSVGVMLYEMLTGRLPFEADSAVSVAIMQLQQNPVLPREINDTIPLGLEQVTMHAMQKDFHKRYRSAAEMLRDLEEFRRSPDMVFDYTYFVDDEPTKFVDVAGAAVISAKTAEDETAVDDANDEDEEKSPVIPILAGVAIAFIAAAIVVAIILASQWGVKTDSITVPRFEGTSYDELKDNPLYSDYAFKVEFQSSSTIPAGTIISQSYQQGRKIKKSQTITIVVSTGPESSVVPYIYNLDLTTAKQVLKSKGFGWKLIYQPNDDVAEGHVIITNPASEASVAEGSEIEVYVSLGAEVEYLTEDEKKKLDCVGFDLEKAKEVIEKLGLTIGDITKEDNAAPKNTVLKQTPDPSNSTKIAKGTAVDLVISTGEASYKYKLSISELPKNFKDKNNEMTLSVWIGGVKVAETPEFEANVANPWSFDLESKNASEKVSINIKFANGVTLKDALVYTVNFSKGTCKLDKNNITNDYLEDKTTDNSSKSDTEGDGGSGTGNNNNNTGVSSDS